uniref:Uncharacterized protein n=1 Tax=Oryza meridionalis TaxID=40149 RepID=A0A0E0EFR0_9ORYZ
MFLEKEEKKSSEKDLGEVDNLSTNNNKEQKPHQGTRSVSSSPIAGKDTSDELVHGVPRESLQPAGARPRAVAAGARRQASSDCSIRISTASSAAASAPASNQQLATSPFTQRGAREGRIHEHHHLVERGQRRRGDRGAGVLGANCVEERPQHGGGERRRGRGGSGGGGKDKAAQRLEGGDERVVRRGVVGYGVRVAEAAAHDG